MKGWGPSLKTCRRQFREGVGAVADAVLQFGVHFAEGFVVAIRHEHRVVAEAARPARRPDETSMRLAAKGGFLAIRPGEREDRDEMGAPVLLSAEFRLHPRHRGAEILPRPGPARRIDARRAAKRW